MKRLTYLSALLAGTLLVSASLRAQNVIISEFMASNSRTLADEDGDFSDWIELYNTTTNTVDLNGWYLSDSRSTPTKWRIPATNMPPNSFLIIFASNKDRKIPGRPLHTNFKLDPNPGEYLGLIRPDLSIATEFNPRYPIQVSDISYGFPVTLSSVRLVTNGAGAKLLIPPNSALGTDWTGAGFNDSSWTSAQNGVGFEAGTLAPFSSVVIADSVSEFSGTQGNANWYYGYYDKKADADGTYNTSDFVQFPRTAGVNVLSATNYWNGTNWDWPNGNPPWTELTSTGGHPSGPNGEPDRAHHWTIRRYVSETNGTLRISGIVSCSSQNGTCGDGTICRVFVDGAEVFSKTVFGESHGYSILVAANNGSLIDFVIDPGLAGNDSCDSTTFTATVRSMAAGGVVADSFNDWSESGIQSKNGWYYGYWDAIDDPPPLGYQTTNFVAFPNAAGPHSADNFWTGASWDWFDGDPPWTEIGREYGIPNRIAGSTGDRGHEQWVIRRWVSEISGNLLIDLYVGKKDVSALEGLVTCRVLQNGVAKLSISLAGNNFAGIATNVEIAGVNVGDAIDFTIEPGANGIEDGTFFNTTIYGSTTLSGQFASNIDLAMRNVNATAYLRIPFNITDPTGINTLTLQMKYDDGFVAYLNGVQVASRNAPSVLAWNSTATAEHPDVFAVQAETFSLSNLRDLLQVGQNVLAIQGLNLSASDNDFLIAAELTGTRPTYNTAVANYFSLPTPGAANGIGTTNLGPLIVEATHIPHEPAQGEDLIINARVSQTYNPVNAVKLYYRVMYQAETNITMFDDGLHYDGVAGDGIYGALIPHSYTNGEMIRYYITARDSLNNLSRMPPFPDPINSEQYLGAVVTNPALTNPLPVLHWFIQTPGAADGDTTIYCSIYFRGEFYDNVGFDIHGQSSRGFAKKSYDIGLKPQHHFQYDPNRPRVHDINMLTTYPDKAHLRNILAYETHGGAGNRSPHHWVVPVRVQMNSQFWGDSHLVENGDDKFLTRIGRDPNGALYKIYNDNSSATLLISGAEKKTRKNEDKSDLQALIAGTTLTGQARLNYFYDNVDVSEAIDFLAAMIITANVDCCHKNFYYYRDTEGDGEWEMFPWDVDLSFGRNWNGACSCYWDDLMYPQNGLNVGGNNYIPAVIFSGSPFLDMYRRRIRTLMDQMLQPTNTPPDQLKYEKRMDDLLASIGPDANLDLLKWTTFAGIPYTSAGTSIPSGVTNGPAYQNMAQAIAMMKTNFFPQRRAFLYGNSAIPAGQPTNAMLLVGGIDYNPSSGNQAEEYIMLRNTNGYYLDISGWAVTGAVRHVFPGGVVIPPNGTNYLAADKKAFRARSVYPKGGQGLYIEGPYNGQLSARGETFGILDTVGRNVVTYTYAGNPSLPQQYLRITEIMYHPARAPAGSPYIEDDYEYLEFKNIGPVALDLTGVHFVTGIEFTFTGSAVTNLNPGEYVLLVRNTNAFVSRYGTGYKIAGQYVGFLENGGENLRLDDAVGEKILDFDYNNSWYPVTDGPGSSLVIVNENAPWDTWGKKASWRPSAYGNGSPAQNDPAPIASVPVLVNEALTHTDPPSIDTIEIYNPTTNRANIGGWFISDDFTDPMKYRIPNNTFIEPGGFILFDETQFNPNPGVPPSFAFSSHGDEAYIFSGNGTNLTSYFHGFAFGAAENGVSFGRYVDSQTNEHFVAQSANTLGGANAYPKVGPIVISEIMYHPPDFGGSDNQQDEFVEIHNITSGSVPLYDPAYPTNTWHLRGGVDFNFPMNQTMDTGAYALIVSFNPTNVAVLSQFRARYSLNSSVAVYGPYDGKLDNSSDSVRLLKPDAPDPGEVPYVLVDEVNYKDETPWPLAADGIGASLQRRNTDQFGDDPINWTGGLSPGGAAGGTPPSLASQSGSQTTVEGHTLTLNATASGSEPLYFVWKFNGNVLQAANSPTLTIQNIQRTQAGKYRLIVFNSAGSAESDDMVVVVQIPPHITAQPISLNARLGATTNFTVTAVSTTPSISYQWRFNGANIPGATSATYTISNIQLSNDGFYDVVVTDSIDSVVSASARLTVLVDPTYVLQPIGAAVPAGSTWTLSVGITNTATLPITYRWRKGNNSIATNTLFSYYDYYIIRNVQGGNFTSNIWDCIVTNLARNSGTQLQSARVPVYAIPDSDGDGIPDDWEIANGFNPNDATDALLDADGDKVNNRDEYISGTDPHDPKSYLKVDQITGTPTATLSFLAMSNRTYRVLYSASVPTNVWSTLVNIAARPTNHIETVVDPGATTRRFYRLATPVQ